ncbi:hypothetical protein AHF37_07005 [Paragonimus kellicotti]|nr:hypothetical protein AHF37_07005 [Paragonimus kellicotti]
MILQYWWLVFMLLLIWIYSRVRSRFCVAIRGQVRTMIILGSGGHTAEMLSYVNILTHEYSPQVYVLASSDQMSEAKISQLMQLKEAKYILERIPRAREVRQPFFSSIFSTIRSFLRAFPLVLRHRPDLILCNGPGTCIPVCFVAYFLCVGFHICYMFDYRLPRLFLFWVPQSDNTFTAANNLINHLTIQSQVIFESEQLARNHLRHVNVDTLLVCC